METESGPFKGSCTADPVRLDLDPTHPDIRPDGMQTFKEFDGGGRRGAVAKIHDKRVDGGAQPPRLRTGEPAVQPAHAVGVGGSAGDVSNRFAAPTSGRAHPFRFLHHNHNIIAGCRIPLPDVTPGGA